MRSGESQTLRGLPRRWCFDWMREHSSSRTRASFRTVVIRTVSLVSGIHRAIVMVSRMLAEEGNDLKRSKRELLDLGLPPSIKLRIIQKSFHLEDIGYLRTRNQKTSVSSNVPDVSSANPVNCL